MGIVQFEGYRSHRGGIVHFDTLQFCFFFEGFQGATICRFPVSGSVNPFPNYEHCFVGRARKQHILLKNAILIIVSLGFCEPYKNKNRMGVKLATGYSFSPIIKVTPVFFITGKTFKNESS